jgi:hypothetical protein
MLIEKEINELENLIGQSGITNPEVSAKGIGWHIDHALRSISLMSKILKKSNPTDFKWQFNKMRFVVFSLRAMPRGKGRAPEPSTNNEEISKSGLESLMADTRKYLIEIENLPTNSYFTHPYFGMMNLAMTKKLIRIHTRHHMKIIRDILGK